MEDVTGRVQGVFWKEEAGQVCCAQIGSITRFAQHHFCGLTLKKDVRRAHVALYLYIPAKGETDR